MGEDIGDEKCGTGVKAGAREGIDVSEGAVQTAEGLVGEAAQRIRARDYTPSPGMQCRRCEVRTICKYAKHR
jgi:DNA helicase-2/ATP-dependent DNA helicase PcrA